MKSVRANLSERALRIFLLHYYSADWIRAFLLEKRFERIFELEDEHDEDEHDEDEHDEDDRLLTLQIRAAAQQREDDLLLCLRASAKLFPTARGLKEIDNIVTKKYTTTSTDRNNDSRFAIFNWDFCIDTRYRMSLLTLADNARESGTVALASLWDTAATAKLDHVSAWQAYAAAKEEESRLLNNTILTKYWQSEKSYTGDVKEKIFDKTIFSVYYHVEGKEAMFRDFLRSKVNQSFHSVIDTCDMQGVVFLRVYCNFKANESKNDVFNRLWMLADTLYAKQKPSFNLINNVISMALMLSRLIKGLTSTYKMVQSKLGNNSPFAGIWLKVSRFIEDVRLRLLLLMEEQLTNAVASDENELELIIEKASASLKRINSFFMTDCFSFLASMLRLANTDSKIKNVMDILPMLTLHPEHSFPDRKKLLQHVFQRLEANTERYIEASEQLMNYHLKNLDPPAEVLKDVKEGGDTLHYCIDGLNDQNNFLESFKKYHLPFITK